MSRSKIILVVMFVLALGAGVVMGVLATKQPIPTRGGHDGKGPGGGPGLFEDLSDAQRAQMRQIWDEFVRSTDSAEKRKLLREERDERINAILTPEQKAAVEKIKEQYDAGLKELGDERHKAWETHVEKTRAILNEEQRKKYDEFLKKRAEHDRGPERGPQHGPPRGPGGPEFGGPWGGGRRSSTRGGPGTRPAVTAAENNAEPTSAPARQ